MKKVFKIYFSHFAIKLYLAMAIFFYVAAVMIDYQSITSKLWILGLPIILAPFFEWWAHKYLLHRIVDQKKEPRAYLYMLELHYKHHWEPNNLETVFAPISSALLVFLIFTPIAFLFLGTQGALIFEAGVISYFLFYEWIHLAHHVPSYRALTSFGKSIRQAHSWHHFKNENFWWGVTNPIGDHLLKTFKNYKEVEASPGAMSLGRLKSEDKK